MIIIPTENESYKDYIQRILSSRDNILVQSEYQELHHIIPKCHNGSNNKDNLIYLYAQEHYYAHKLLAKENPSDNGLQLAWWNMCQCSQNGERIYDITADDYANARKQFVKHLSNNQYAKGNKFTPEMIARQKATHPSENYIGSKNPMYGKHCSDHCKALLSAKLSGANNPAARKVRCLETGLIFETAKSAAEYCHISRSDIAAQIGGRQKSAGKDPVTGEKLHWEYIE